MSKVVYMKKDETFQGFRLEQESYDKVPDGKGDHKMSNNESMETLFKEIKLDMREREDRTRREISEREERFEKQLATFAREATERELRFTSEIKEQEKRLNKSVDEIKTSVSDLKKEFEGNTKHIEGIKSQSFWGTVAVIAAFFIGMAGMIITLIVSL